jgi:hypothetical protein
MGDLPLIYKPIEPSTWAYLSTLLMFGLYFKFNRLFSVRNIDLFLLLMLSPGLLLVHYGAKSRFVAESHLPVQLHAASAYKTDPVETRPTSSDPDSEPQTTSTNPTQTDANGKLIPEHVKYDEDWLTEQKRAIQVERQGYVWLFVAGLAMLVRFLLDPGFTRRPLLEPNLNKGGLIFLGAALVLFLFLNIAYSRAQTVDFYGIELATSSSQKDEHAQRQKENLKQYGPGYSLLRLIPIIPTVVTERTIADEVELTNQPAATNETVAKLLVILCQITIVVTIVGIGHYHFGNVQMGIGAATLYLILPYTAMMTGRIIHILPGALMVWAILVYRRPTLSGVFVGLAAGFAYFPVFCLPVWLSFYWKRGVKRFTASLLMTLLFLAMILYFSSNDWGSFVGELRKMFGFWLPITEGLSGIWRLGWDPWYRLPILAACFVMCLAFTYWPTEKDFGTLISCSCVTLIAVQFWHGLGGGLYMGWYLPLALLTFFRPNLQDKTAEAVVPEFEWSRVNPLIKR